MAPEVLLPSHVDLKFGPIDSSFAVCVPQMFGLSSANRKTASKEDSLRLLKKAPKRIFDENSVLAMYADRAYVKLESRAAYTTSLGLGVTINVPVTPILGVSQKHLEATRDVQSYRRTAVPVA